MTIKDISEVRQLIDLGKKRGYVTTAEVNRALPTLAEGQRVARGLVALDQRRAGAGGREKQAERAGNQTHQGESRACMVHGPASLGRADTPVNAGAARLDSRWGALENAHAVAFPARRNTGVR